MATGFKKVEVMPPAEAARIVTIMIFDTLQFGSNNDIADPALKKSQLIKRKSVPKTTNGNEFGVKDVSCASFVIHRVNASRYRAFSLISAYSLVCLTSLRSWSFFSLP